MAKPLVDGDYYRFKYDGKFYTGYYDSATQCFIDNDNVSYQAGSCTSVSRI